MADAGAQDKAGTTDRHLTSFNLDFSFHILGQDKKCALYGLYHVFFFFVCFSVLY